MRKKLAYLLVISSIICAVAVPTMNVNAESNKQPEILTTSGHGFGLGNN
ncbi:hypothetical protein M2277_001097 [Paenibacillus sp. LBL]|nr:hypothetical protein [Paenibacillus sp. LBL]